MDVTLTLASYAGRTVKMTFASPDGTQDWNGSAFVTASTAAKNAGAVTGVESPAGTFTFTVPAGITTPGVYPYAAWAQVGGSFTVATAERLTPPSGVNTVIVTGGAVALPAATYTPTAAWDGAYQAIRVPIGTDVPLRFTVKGGDSVIDGSQFEVRVGVEGQSPLATFTVAGSTLVADNATGRLTVNWTAAQTAAFPDNLALRADVYRTNPLGSKSLVGRATLRMVANIS